MTFAPELIFIEYPEIVEVELDPLLVDRCPALSADNEPAILYRMQELRSGNYSVIELHPSGELKDGPKRVEAARRLGWKTIRALYSGEKL
jgi:hypothetical protein